MQSNEANVKSREKLDECPFCGGEAEICEYDIIGKPAFYIECTKETCRGCGMPFQKFARRSDAIKDWNTRTPDYRSLLESARDALVELDYSGIVELHSEKHYKALKEQLSSINSVLGEGK